MTTTLRQRRFPRYRGPVPGRALREAGVLLAVAVVGTGLSWALRTDGLSLRADPTFYERELSAPLVGPAEALALYDAGTHLFIDTRADDPVRTVPGAFHVREDTFDDDLLRNFDFLTPADPLVVFGDGGLAAASNVAARLQQRGWTDVVIMSGGMAAWQAAGGPVSEREETP